MTFKNDDLVWVCVWGGYPPSSIITNALLNFMIRKLKIIAFNFQNTPAL